MARQESLLAELASGPEAGACWTALGVALYAAENLRSYEQAMRWVIGLGGDTDTNAAVAGALIGARDGGSAIPERWLGTLRDRDRSNAPPSVWPCWPSRVRQPTFEELQEVIIAENTFHIAYVEAWAFRGVCPPPLLGDPWCPTHAFLSLSLRDRWSQDDAPLLVCDEHGVETQRAATEAKVRHDLDLTVRQHGTDMLLFKEAQNATRRLGTWVEPREDHRGSYWSTLGPSFSVWGAAAHPDTARLLGASRRRVQRSRVAEPWLERRLRRDADMFDSWLLREIRRTCRS